MSLAIIDNIRQALDNGHALRHSDILALCATTEQLWLQTVNRRSIYKGTEHRREYMRHYMRRYRAAKRTHAITDVSATALAAMG